MTLTEIYISLQIALTAWTIRNILMAPGEVLRPYFNYLDRLVVNGKERIAKPLGYCDKCLAGQMAFWGYFLMNLNCYSIVKMPAHAAFICLTVFVVYQLQRVEIHED